ncbi:MAG: hypothetical protein ACE5GW_07515 [Planctomycetota bacterium]
MRILANWNRLALGAALVTPFAGVLACFGLWETVLHHGPGRGNVIPLRVGLLLLVLCGLCGALAAGGVGSSGGRRKRGRILGWLLVPIGSFAARAL